MTQLEKLLERLQSFRPSVVACKTLNISAACLYSPRLLEAISSFKGLLIILDAEALGEIPENIHDVCLFVIGSSGPLTLGQGNCSLIRFPKDTDKAALYEACRKGIEDADTVREVCDRLFQVFVARSGVKKILTTAEEILGNPLVVYEISSRIMFVSNERFFETTEDEMLANSRANIPLTMDFARKYDFDIISRMLNASAEPIIYPTTPGAMRRRMMCRISYQNEAFGHCAIIEEFRPMQETDKPILRYLTSILSMELERTNYLSYKNDTFSVVLHELYDHTIRTEDEFYTRIAPLHWTSYSNFFVINFSMRGVIAKPVETQILLNSLRMNLRAYPAGSHLMYDNDRVICLFDFQDTGKMEKVKPILMEYLRAEKLTAALSRPFTDITEFHRHVDFTEKLLNTARETHCEQPLLDYDDLYFFHIAAQLGERMEPMDFCLHKLRELREYDTLNKGDLYATVWKYLACGKSVSQCAEALFVHKNTVLRRIAKFTELTGLDLQKGEDAYKLWFSFRLLEYKEALDRR